MASSTSLPAAPSATSQPRVPAPLAMARGTQSTWRSIADFYVDGTPIFSSSSIDKGFNTLNDLNLGRFLDGNFGIHGTMDEARIRGATSSANWVWAEYMTVAANSSFQSYSSVSNSLVTLSFQVQGNKLILSWPSGTLLQAPSLFGPWSTNNAASPYTNIMSGSEYFRVKVR